MEGFELVSISGTAVFCRGLSTRRWKETKVWLRRRQGLTLKDPMRQRCLHGVFQFCSTSKGRIRACIAPVFPPGFRLCRVYAPMCSKA